MTLLIGLLPGHATVRPDSGGDPPPVDRAQAVELLKTGGPETAARAEVALLGTDADVRAFVSEGRNAAEEVDLRAAVEQVLAAGGSTVRGAAQTALDGGPTAMRTFLDQGWKQPWEEDLRVEINQVLAAATGRYVRAAANKALDGTADDQLKFLETGYQEAQDADDRIRVSQLSASGGPHVREAASAAMDGSIDDVHDFLGLGYEVAAARDAETDAVSQLADLADDAGRRAALQTQAAQEASARAVRAAELAKKATERAARETEAAKDSAHKAAAAAARAARAAERAARAARIAIDAADAANRAARIASAAASRAATAASLAGRAAANANRAAEAAHRDARHAAAARSAAENARDVAVGARTAAKAAQAAADAAIAAGNAAVAAANAGAHANQAAGFANQADQWATQAGADAQHARQAAAYAQRRAAAAIRAANKVQHLARQTADAARQAEKHANDAALHAERAADAADDAAAHAGEAKDNAAVSTRHANDASASASQATAAANQAQKVHDLAREVDEQRLASWQDRQTADAEDALAVETESKAKAEWEAGQAQAFEAETNRLLAQARADGAPRPTVIGNGREVAVRLLKTGGPHVRRAAEIALAGGEEDTIEFVRTGLGNATEADDRASLDHVATQAETDNKPQLREAAYKADEGDHAEVKAFLETGQHRLQMDDYRIQVTQISADGGPWVRKAASAALDADTPQALLEFISSGQHTARETDDRLAINQMLPDAGPELNAAAQAALSGPATYVREFVQVGQHNARQRDADQAAHVAEIGAFLASAHRTAATARENAAEAQAAAARARGAAAEADAHAKQARAHANEAKAHANAARASADRAHNAAQQAARSAKIARQAAKDAQAAAKAAAQAAARADRSASQARAYADEAREAAERARRDAIQAGKDAAAAARAAAEAAAAAERKRREEQAQGRKDKSSPGSSVSDEQIILAANGQQGLDQYRNARANAAKSVMDFVVSIGGKLVLDVIGWTDAKNCFTKGDIVGCLFTALNALGPLKLIGLGAKLKPIGKTIWRIATGIGPFRKTVSTAHVLIRKTDRMVYVARRIEIGCKRSSFTPGTGVLMADGSRRPIENVQVGDRVLATDPKTGATTPRKVLRTISTKGDKQLVSVTVRGGGAGEPVTYGQVTASSEHPFWVGGSTREWVHAERLKPGMRLRSSTGKYVLVTGLRAWTTPDQRVHNLTVEGVRTYYVEAGTALVLVHNCGRSDHDNAFGLLHMLEEIGLHVLPKHGPNSTMNAAKFNEEFGSAEAIIELIWQVLEATGSPQTSRHCHWLNLGRFIGKAKRNEDDKDYTETKYVVLWFYPNGKFSSIYPTLKEGC
ncbi:polymorphic toxin-type HINT domain-containing protein [Actinomadura spongiicola]|nr:polymorphic toxin-type HINT domain-containing protein [Actinomadura spongiicola]